MSLPEFASDLALLEFRGRREDRVRAAPAVPCAIAHRENAHEHTGSAEHPGLPCAMALRLIRALPGERLFCHRRPEKLRFPGLNASTANIRTTRFRRTPPARTSIAPSASIASHRTFVTIAKRPSMG